MDNPSIPAAMLKPNLVDKTAESATDAVNATKHAASALFDSVSDKVEGLRSTLSPALESASAPMDSLVKYTQENPLKALAFAAGAGAVLFALFGPRRRLAR